jgi:hypothetical protein
MFSAEKWLFLLSYACHSGLMGGITIPGKKSSSTLYMIEIGLIPRQTKGFFDLTP